jgi:hypothetical protein
MELMAETEVLEYWQGVSLVGRGNALPVMLLSMSGDFVMLNSSRIHHTAFQESVYVSGC